MLDPKATFRNPIQIGIICRDLEQTMENFKNILGVGEFRVADFPPAGCGNTTRVYHEKQGDFVGKFCFYDWGNIELELIQPISGSSVWFDYLEKTPNGLGIHHVKFMVERQEPVKEYFDSLGIDRVLYGEGVGPNTGRIFAFYDTFEKLGFDVEILNSKRDGEE